MEKYADISIHAFPKPNDSELKKYPLLDLLKANVELRLDDASEFLLEHRLPNYNLPLVKHCIKILPTEFYSIMIPKECLYIYCLQQYNRDYKEK